MYKYIFLFFIIYIIYKNIAYSIENYTENAMINNINTKPNLFVYWENIDGAQMPDYIQKCRLTLHKHCNKSFNIIELNEKNIKEYLPTLPILPPNLLIQQKVDYYRIMILAKYGGLYIDSDVIIMRDPIEIINKLNEYDFVGFGCTGDTCLNGYMKPSNAIMASRKDGILITKILDKLNEKLTNKKIFDYFDLGKFVIWEVLDEFKNINYKYKYFHYDNSFDGTRDKYGKWVFNDRLFSNKQIDYLHWNMFFIMVYNSEMKDLKYKKFDDLKNTNFYNFINKSLNYI